MTATIVAQGNTRRSDGVGGGRRFNRIGLMPDVHLSPSGEESLSRLSLGELQRLGEEDVGGGNGPISTEIDALVSAWKSTLDARLLRRLPSLRIIALRATSTRRVDIEFADRQQISVANIQGYGDIGTSEFVVEQLLRLSRRHADGDAEWPRELRGKRLGLVGFGAVAQLTANIARPMGMEIGYYVPTPGAKSRPSTASYWPLPELLETADFISFHSPAYERVLSLSDLRHTRPCAAMIVTTLGLPFGVGDFLKWKAAAPNRVVFDLCAAHEHADELSDCPRVEIHQLFSARTVESIDRAEKMVIDNLATFLETTAAHFPRSPARHHEVRWGHQ